MRRQAVGQDGDEDEIVDAEDDLQHDQRDKAGDDVGVEERLVGIEGIVDRAALRVEATARQITVLGVSQK